MASPRVRGFTDQNRPLRLEVEVSETYELLLALFVIQAARHDDEELKNQELVARLESALSGRSDAAIDRLSSSAMVWATLLGEAHQLHPSSPDEFAAHLASADPVELRRRILRNAGYLPHRGHDPEALERAALGDPSGIEGTVEYHDERDLLRFFELSPEAGIELLVAAFRSAHTDLGPTIAATMESARRDADATTSLASTMTPGEVVEHVTNGVSFEMVPGLARVVLVPSHVIDPWVVMSEHEDVRIVCYPISADTSVPDPGMPSDRLVQAYKALGDEKRLRLLHLLTGEERTLMELATKLDLAKSTTHHHLRALRTAGLIRVVVDDGDKRFVARPEAVDHIARMLGDYLDGAVPTPETGKD